MSFTFQKMWKIAVGQFDGGVFTPSFELTKHDFVAKIDAEGKGNSCSETPPISTISLYNVGHEIISILTSDSTLYVKLSAGYLFAGSSIQTTYESLPEVYTGYIHYSETKHQNVDVVTTLHCTPAFDKLSKARINKSYAKGTLASQIFTDIANSAEGMTVVLDYKVKDSQKLKSKKTVEGISSIKLTEFCNKWELRSYVEKNVLYIVDKDAKVKSGGTMHVIPLSRVKGVVELSMDVAQIIKDKSKVVPEISFTTFLYPEITLYDGVRVDIPNYGVPVKAGEAIATTQQDFVIMEYSHELDSSTGGSWETRISGKGEQENAEE